MVHPLAEWCRWWHRCEAQTERPRSHRMHLVVDALADQPAGADSILHVDSIGGKMVVALQLQLHLHLNWVLDLKWGMIYNDPCSCPASQKMFLMRAYSFRLGK